MQAAGSNPRHIGADIAARGHDRPIAEQEAPDHGSATMAPGQSPFRLEARRDGCSEKRAKHQAEIHHAAAFRE